jgi:rhamnosyltransferase
VERVASRFGCELVLNGANLGIAKALNLGIARAAELDSYAVVLFDQDSVVNEGYVQAMLNAYKERSSACRVGIAVPEYRDRLSGDKMLPPRGPSGELLTAMTSGSFVPIRMFDEFGMHEESLFIDYVDIEISLRFRSAGYRIVDAPGAELQHSVGRRSNHVLLGRPFACTNHSPNRRYYITRNRFTVLRRYWRDWRWIASEARGFCTETIKLLLVEDHRILKCCRMMAGLMDSIRRRTGMRFEL